MQIPERDKQAEARTLQESEIEAAAFRSLLTANERKSDLQATHIVVLWAQNQDRKDIRFLKDLHRSDILVRRFEEIKKVATYDDPRSEALGIGARVDYRDRATGRDATVYTLDKIKWISESEAEIHCFVAPNPRGGWGGTYELVRKNGKWSVKGIKKGSEYRA